MRDRLGIWLLLLGFAPLSARAQIAPRQARVEVITPEPPTAVVVDGKRVLVYELHVANFGRGPLRFREIDVMDAGNHREARGAVKAQQPIASYRDSALKALLQAPGMQHSEDAARLEPAQLTIVFMWLSFPLNADIPTTLRHRLTFDILDSADVRRDGGTISQIDSILLPVSTESVPTLRAPLDGGEWVVGSGPSNTSDHRRSLIAVNGRAYLAQRFAIDWMRVGPNGNTYQGDEHRNESYWSFGQPVHSVASGEVVAVVDSIADHAPHGPLPPVTLANIAGNYVTVRIGPDKYATYAHLEHGSIRVRVGERVQTGAVLALVGDTGQATAPHLHFQITDAPGVLTSEGVPFLLDRFRFLGYAADFEETKHPNAPRSHELPMEDEVVGLP
ncbi:MAG: M23 family metallopeptidase [Gemmatimonadaceae bacterium]